VQSAPFTRRRGARVSWIDLKTKVDGFSWFSLKISGYGFPGLGLKTGSYGLVIWASKSPRRFLSLGLKTKWSMVCLLHHNTDGRMKTARTRVEIVTPHVSNPHDYVNHMFKRP
jgi:hypothetical protein